MESITRQDACNLIVDALTKDGGLDHDEVKKVVFGVNNDMQVRDFLMGLPKFFDMEKVANLLVYFSVMAKNEDQAPFLSILAMCSYEMESKEDSLKLLSMADEIKPNYSLTTLLRRVFEAGWPSSALTQMRNELADKVLVECYGQKGMTVIVEGGAQE